MEIWHEGVYGNESAQAFLEVLLDLFYESDSPDEFVEEARAHSWIRYPECRFVLADFEADFVGDVFYYPDVVSMLEQELEEETLSKWTNPSLREQVLNGFKRSLSHRLDTYHPLNSIPFFEFPTWFETKRDASELESVLK